MSHLKQETKGRSYVQENNKKEIFKSIFNHSTLTITLKTKAWSLLIYVAAYFVNVCRYFFVLIQDAPSLILFLDNESEITGKEGKRVSLKLLLKLEE